MAEYIKRKKVRKMLNALGGCGADPGSWANGWDKAIDTAIEELEEIPAADVAPVVHGRWKFSEKLETLDMTIYECSACGGQLLPSKAEKSEWSKNPRYAYCSYCGARMDGDKND